MAAAALLLSCLLPAAFAAEISVPGAGSPQAVVAALAAAFNQSQSAHRVTVPPTSGVAGALRAIRSKESVLARSARPLNEAETREGLRCLPFVRIPLVFVIGAGVAVDRLSEAQLAGIFSGKITDWRELGGKPAPIRVVVRPPAEVMLQDIRKTLPAFRNLEFGAEAKLVQSDDQALDLLDRFDSAIGWAALTNLPSAKSALKPVHLDGVAPNAENLANGKYRIGTTGCFVHMESVRDPAARAFLDFVFSTAGGDVIRKLGALAVARQ